MNQRLKKDQYLVPYLMSSMQIYTLKEAVQLAEYCRDLGYMPERQPGSPTPSTISTCMYYTGVDPHTMKPVYVPKNAHEKALQRALIQYRNPDNYDLVLEALKKAGRMDLVGAQMSDTTEEIEGQAAPPKERKPKKKTTIRSVQKKKTEKRRRS